MTCLIREHAVCSTLSVIVTQTVTRKTEQSITSEADHHHPIKKIENYLPEAYPLEIIPSPRKRDECDENTGLHLGHPFFRFLFFNEYYWRVDPTPTTVYRIRSPFTTGARDPFQPRLHFFSPCTRCRRARASRPTQRPPEFLKLGVRLSRVVSELTLSCCGWRRAWVAVAVRT